MRKFLNTLSLCLAILAIGSWLNATPYPTGGAGQSRGPLTWGCRNSLR